MRAYARTRTHRHYLATAPTAAEAALIEVAKAASEAGGPPPQLIESDHLSFDSVRRAATQLKEATLDGLDVLCCNAGIM